MSLGWHRYRIILTHCRCSFGIIATRKGSYKIGPRCPTCNKTLTLDQYRSGPVFKAPNAQWAIANYNDPGIIDKAAAKGKR